MSLNRTALRRLKGVEAVLVASAEERGDVGFLPRAFVLLGLPHSNPGTVPVWSRKNGDAVLILQPGYTRQGDAEVCLGYPFGGIARLLLLSLCTSAVRTQSPNLEIGYSLRQFTLALGFEPDGRRMAAISEQLTRLLAAAIQFQFRDRTFYARNAPIAAEFFLWRHEKTEERTTGFVRLSEFLFRDLIAHPVPVDMRAFACLLDAPLALDLFIWLSFRLREQRGILKLSWRALRQQFGSDYRRLKEFARHMRRQLRRVQSVWPELDVKFWPGGVTFNPPTKLPVAMRDRELR